MPLLLRAAHVDDVPPGTCREVKLRASKVLVCRTGDEFHAIGAKCPHMGLPLKAGDFDGERVTCRYHGAAVDVRTGRLVAQPNRAEWAKGSIFRRLATILGRAKKPKDSCGAYRVEVRGKYVFVAIDADREQAPAIIQSNERERLAPAAGCPAPAKVVEAIER
jgi:nitrite reductase/ring-hydroxylating ferredoxin subunit